MDHIYDILKTDVDTSLSLIDHIHEVASRSDDNHMERIISHLKQTTAFLEEELKNRHAPPRPPYNPPAEEIDIDEIAF